MSWRLGNLLLQFLFRSDAAGIAVPLMDGPLTPNESLTAADDVVEIPNIRDMTHAGGTLYIAADTAVWKVDLRDPVPSELAVFDDQVGALTTDGSTLFAAIAGMGVVTVDTKSGTAQAVTTLAARCPTAMAVRADTLLVAEGTTEHGLDDWAIDLMTKGASGRLSAIDLTTGEIRTLRERIRYCAGVAFSSNGEDVIYSEAWAHRLMRTSLTPHAPARAVTGDMPAYPGRISVSPRGDYWLSAFAVRTYLIEFVLSQDEYREEMIRSIPQDYWIRPYLHSSTSGLDPLQGGQLKKLGVTKPWAPARSYGLVARLDPDFNAVESYHSRASGRLHGVVQAFEHDGELFIASAGASVVARTPVSAADEVTAVAW